MATSKIVSPINYAEITGTTTQSGALALPSAYLNTYKVISLLLLSHNGLCYFRKDGYAQCYNTSLEGLVSTDVKIGVYYK